MVKEKIVLIGGGGHCRSCIDVIEATNEYDIVGIIDKKEMLGTDVFGYPVIATDEDLPIKGIKKYIVTVGQIKSPEIRKNIVMKLYRYRVEFPIIVSPTAYVSPRASIGEGTIIMHKAVLNAGVRVGVHCIVNSAALLEHDAEIGDFCHISTGAIVNGEAKIGGYSFIGSNSTINQLVQIPENVVVGSGTTVRKRDTIPSGTIYVS